ncbi:MAG: FkbM family methyltransferase [Salibacteraceae bacterium]
MKKIVSWLYRQSIFFLASNNMLVYRWYLSLYRPTDDPLAVFFDRFSKSKNDFFVVQVGANDGITHDPIHKFIKRDHWRGILLEPQTWVFERFTKKMYQKDEGINVINAAIGHEDGEASMYKLSFSNDRWASGLTRFNRSLLQKLIDDGRLDKRIRRNNIKLPSNPDDWIEEVKVRVRSFSSLLLELNVGHIDLLMIDTEGFDAEVIKMLDLDEYLPTVIVFEDMHLSKEDYSECVSRLHSFRYQTHRCGPNTIAWQQEADAFVPWKTKN